MKILFISPAYFSYTEMILEEIKSLGFDVVNIQDRPTKNQLFIALIRVIPSFTAFLTNLIYLRLFKNIRKDEFDIVFVLQGESITQKLLLKLKQINTKAKFIFYTWDSIKNKPNSLLNLDLYDYRFTFDPIDAIKYKMIYRPLFSKKYHSDIIDIKYDYCFIGTLHSDRYKIIKNIQNKNPKLRKTYLFLYCQAKWLFWFKRLFTNTLSNCSKKEVSFVPLKTEDVQKIFSQSKIIIDIEHKNQNGLTMRSIDALMAKKKLITTNKNIANHRIYNPKYIHILDRDNPIIPPNYFDNNLDIIPDDELKPYHISRWVKDIIINNSCDDILKNEKNTHSM